jgi:hypothetical protein
MRGVADRFGRFVVPLPSRREHVDLRFIRSADWSPFSPTSDTARITRASLRL